jgi:hypothetical protein
MASGRHVWTRTLAGDPREIRPAEETPTARPDPSARPDLPDLRVPDPCGTPEPRRDL